MARKHRRCVEPAIPVRERERRIDPKPLRRKVREVPATAVAAARQRGRSLVEATARRLDDLKGGLWGAVHIAPRYGRGSPYGYTPVMSFRTAHPRTRRTLAALRTPLIASVSVAAIAAAVAVSHAKDGKSAATPSAGSSSPGAGSAMWSFDFKPRALQLYVDAATGEGYWCLTYTVTNLTGTDRQWMPKVEMLDDQGRIHSAGRSVSPSITKAVKELLGNPLLEDQFQVIGPLRHGRDNAKDGLLIWSAEPCDATELTVFVRGLSGETETVEDPITKSPVVLYKTARLEYRVPGDVKHKPMAQIPVETRDWVFR